MLSISESPLLRQCSTRHNFFSLQINLYTVFVLIAIVKLIYMTLYMHIFIHMHTSPPPLCVLGLYSGSGRNGALYVTDTETGTLCSLVKDAHW